MFEGNYSVRIRNLEREDLEMLRKIRNEPSTWLNLNHPGMLDEKDQVQWYESLLGRSDTRYLVSENDQSKFLGVIRMDEIDNVNKSMRVGCDVSPEFRGQGFGKATMQTVLQYCFDHLGFHRVWLAVLTDNLTAKTVYEKCGFLEEGRYREAVFRDGKYHDYIVMSILEDEYRN